MPVRERACFGCGRPGHYRADCPDQVRGPPPPRQAGGALALSASSASGGGGPSSGGASGASERKSEFAFAPPLIVLSRLAACATPRHCARGPRVAAGLGVDATLTPFTLNRAPCEQTRPVLFSGATFFVAAVSPHLPPCTTFLLAAHSCCCAPAERRVCFRGRSPRQGARVAASCAGEHGPRRRRRHRRRC
jgi:hypothetical protein